MRDFSRRGFQIRSARIETRVAYTGFLALMVPGLATLVALSVGRIGFGARAIATYYRGGESEMSFPKTFWQLMEVSHFHLFTIPVVVLILAHLLHATPTSTRFRVWLTVLTNVGAVLDVSGPWAVRYLAAASAYALLVGWALLAGGAFMIVAVSLLSMWGPESWVARLASTPEQPDRGSTP